MLATLVLALAVASRPPLPPLLRRATVPCMVDGGNSEILKTLEKLETEVQEAAAAAKERKEAELRVASQQQQRVTAFGARLDDDIAGQEFSGPKGQEDYERQFDQGVALMQRGEYNLAVSAFTQAVVNAPKGLSGRKGGQYAIYLAQALQAANRKQEAVGLLKRCEAHPDSDVRKISENVLYVMQAPELKLDADQFLSIPSFEEQDDWGPRRIVKQDKDPPPEKYSLEWYQLEAEKRKSRQAEEPPPATAPAFVASGVMLCAAFGLLLTR